MLFLVVRNSCKNQINVLFADVARRSSIRGLGLDNYQKRETGKSHIRRTADTTVPYVIISNNIARWQKIFGTSITVLSSHGQPFTMCLTRVFFRNCTIPATQSAQKSYISTTSQKPTARFFFRVNFLIHLYH